MSGSSPVAIRSSQLRAHKREALLEATEQELEKIRDRIEHGALAGAARSA